MKVFKEIYQIAKRELTKIFKDTNLLLVFIFAPLAYPAIYGAIYFNKTEQKVPVAVVDYDNSNFSHSLIRTIDAAQFVNIAYSSANEQDAKELITTSKVQAIVIIHQNFERDIKEGKRTNVNLIISPARLLVLSDVGVTISKAVSTFGYKITASVLAKKGIPAIQEKSYIQPISIDFRYLNNPYMTYGDMMLPALMIFIISQLIFIATGAASAKEFEFKLTGEMYSITKSNIKIFLGKIISYLALFCISALFVILILIPIFDVKFVGSYISIFVIVTLGLTASASMGIFFGSCLRSVVVAFAVLVFTSYPFFIISGYAWPVQQLPVFIQYFSYLFPSTPFLQAVYYVTQMNCGLSDIIPQLCNFVGIIALYFIGFVIRMGFAKRKNMKQIALAVAEA